jgi:hypothetical protein
MDISKHLDIVEWLLLDIGSFALHFDLYEDFCAISPNSFYNHPIFFITKVAVLYHSRGDDDVMLNQ